MGPPLSPAQLSTVHWVSIEVLFALGYSQAVTIDNFSPRPSNSPWRKPWRWPLQVTPGFQADIFLQGKNKCLISSARKYVLNLSVIWLPGSGQIVHGFWDRNIPCSWSGCEKAEICVGKLQKWREEREKLHALVVYAFQTFTNSG